MVKNAAATVETEPQERTRSAASNTKPRRQPPYAVVLHNDPYNSFPFVVGVLGKVFGYGQLKAHTLTLTAHETGRSVVWIGPLEVAELKADQIRSCGPDPTQVTAGAQRLTVTLEPLPE